MYENCAHANAGQKSSIGKDDGGRDVHHKVVCDLCNMHPIVGPRFQSLSVSDFDICEACHSKPQAGQAGPYKCIRSHSGVLMNGQ